MKIVKGQYNEAAIYASIVEPEAEAQIKELCDQEWARDSHIAIMADTHAGAGCTIGTSMTLNGKVCPNLVGVDIGCGMLVANLGKIEVDLEKFDKAVHAFIPAGRNINQGIFPETEYLIDNIKAPLKDANYILRSVGTLGGGR